jgi:tRNA 2-selenouridine synthase
MKSHALSTVPCVTAESPARAQRRSVSAVPAVGVEALTAARRAGVALLIVDLRSPAEFAEDHLPGAQNVPLFDDAERALVGTLYRCESPQRAFDAGRAIASRRARALVDRIAELSGWSAPPGDLAELVRARTERGFAAFEAAHAAERAELAEFAGELPARAVVLSCWRGGMRSRSVAALLRQLGCDRAVLLDGGYRAWRAHVAAALAAARPPRSYVLRGLTGTGKTLLLREIERLRPGWTIDLEDLAQHRSSILGMVGRSPRSQKAFESLLLERLERGFPGGLAVLEGESRKVGDVVLARAVWEAIDGGVAIEVTASAERRVDVLLADYLAEPQSRAELAARLPFIEERLGPSWSGRLSGLLERGRERELAALLLERYYDPLYRHSERGRRYAHSVANDVPAEAARAIVEWIEAR